MLRVAVVGFGNMGSARADWYYSNPDVSLAAVADPTESRLDAAKDRFPGTSLFTSIEDLLLNESVDVVDICSPPAFHEQQTRDAIRQERHVICEKPAVLRSSSGPDLVTLAREHSRLIYPIHNYVFSPAMRMMNGAVRSKAYGRLIGGEFTVSRQTHAKGVTDWRPDWRRDPEIAGGGIIFDHGTHCIYMALRLCGRLPARVSATLSRSDPFGVEDQSQIILDFGGVVWRIDLNWNADFKRTYYRLHFDKCLMDFDEPDAAPVPGERDWNPGPQRIHDSVHMHWFRYVFSDFTQVMSMPIEYGLNRFQEAVIVSHVVEAAYESARTGQWVNPSYGATLDGYMDVAMIGTEKTSYRH